MTVQSTPPENKTAMRAGAFSSDGGRGISKVRIDSDL